MENKGTANLWGLNLQQATVEGCAVVQGTGHDRGDTAYN